MHGYDLKAAFEGDLAPASRLNYGQVYTTLERLNRDGRVTPAVVAGEKHPDRIVYSITDTGREELQEWLDSATDIDLDWRNESFLKVMLAHRLARRSPGDNGLHADPLSVIAAERRAYMDRLSEIQADRAAAEREGKPLAALLLFDLAVMRLEAFYKWLEHCEEALAKEHPP